MGIWECENDLWAVHGAVHRLHGSNSSLLLCPLENRFHECIQKD